MDIPPIESIAESVELANEGVFEEKLKAGTLDKLLLGGSHLGSHCCWLRYRCDHVVPSTLFVGACYRGFADFKTAFEAWETTNYCTYRWHISEKSAYQHGMQALLWQTLRRTVA